MPADNTPAKVIAEAVSWFRSDEDRVIVSDRAISMAVIAHLDVAGLEVVPKAPCNPRDVHRSGVIVCPACVKFGRHECAEHRATGVDALDAIPTLPVPEVDHDAT